MFYKPAGCSECGHTGYRGRAGLAETLEVTPEIRTLIMEGRSEAQLRRHARLAGMKTLRENGLEKFIKGITSLEEVVRLTAKEAEIHGRVA